MSTHQIRDARRVGVRVKDLVGGDVIENLGMRSATFIGRSDHPQYPGLALVVWRLDDGTISLDALDYRQVVGNVTSSGAGWDRRLKIALGNNTSTKEN